MVVFQTQKYYSSRICVIMEGVRAVGWRRHGEAIPKEAARFVYRDDRIEKSDEKI